MLFPENSANMSHFCRIFEGDSTKMNRLHHDFSNHLNITDAMLTKQDLDLLKRKGISRDQLDTQLNYFKTGFPFLPIVGAASIGDGILRVEKGDEADYVKAWKEYLKGDKKVTKFVPASGAASRMFKDLFAFIDAEYDEPTTPFEKTFFDGIQKFAFFDVLDALCKERHGKGVTALCAEGCYKDVVKALLGEKGMEYGNLPKGLLLFHAYPGGNRVPVEEHMKEGAMYAKDGKGNVDIHFTVSGNHQPLFEKLVADRKAHFERELDAKISVSFSVQKPSTDTVAVDMENQPFRETDGTILFRPGGHGALIENLNEIDSDVIFIKNIDNVVPDRLKEEDARYKTLLAGVLVTLQAHAFEYLEKLESGKVDADELLEIVSFVEDDLSITPPAGIDTDAELKSYLRAKLDRPFRVCGMVKNVGEPGGGPFIAVNSDGSSSLQILEGSQIDKNDEKAVSAFKNGSHFNPVDLVCGVKNWKGEKYDLTQHVDKRTGFISRKSKDGRELKALELPGLWNGAMSDWNTLFVEVPISTFNPVKTVNDLLRPEHQ